MRSKLGARLVYVAPMTDLAFYEGLAQEMLGRLNRLRSFTQHNLSVGLHHEEILRSTIRNIISPRFQLRSGFAFAGQGAVSRQGDILIVDESDPAPYFFREGDLVVVRSRALACVIEVKTTLNKKAFLDSLINLASFQEVAARARTQHAGTFKHPWTFVFTFGGGMAPEILGRWYQSVTLADECKNYPKWILSLKGGLLRCRQRPGTDEWCHYFVGDPNSRRGSKAKELSVFLAGIRKAVEYRVGIESNPYDDAAMENLHWSLQSFHYGRGLLA